MLITHRSGTLFWLGVIRVKAWRLPRRQLESRVKIVAGVQDIIDMCVYIDMLTKNEGESYHRRGPEGSGSGKDGGVMLRLNLLWVTRSSSSTIPTTTDNCE